MHNRINNWIKKEGLKSSELADTIGVNRSTISHVLSGRNKPSIDFLQKLLFSYPNINANWLITGDGNMYVTNFINDTIPQKKVEKVVVFYDDSSFDELKS